MGVACSMEVSADIRRISEQNSLKHQQLSRRARGVMAGGSNLGLARHGMSQKMHEIRRLERLLRTATAGVE